MLMLLSALTMVPPELPMVLVMAVPSGVPGAVTNWTTDAGVLRSFLEQLSRRGIRKKINIVLFANSRNTEAISFLNK
jgi:hypothetical protein